MTFEAHILEGLLAEYIESVFHFKGFQPDHSIERVVPTGHLFIIFELDGIPRNTFDNTTLKANATFKNAWISGMHKNYLSISAHPNSEMLVIQFKPHGAHPFLQIPIHQLNNKVVPANDILEGNILDLRKEILSYPTAKEKFKVVETWLLKRFASRKSPSEDLTAILHKLYQNPINEHQTIIQSYSKTQKHLINQFKKYFGLTPKVLHRIFRFNEILQQIHTEKQISWPQIAYQFGYTDQSHFIKEFKEFSGFNPKEFIVSDYHKEQPNFFPLDKKG